MTDVYLLPAGFQRQLDKLVEKQRETHRRMLEQLLMVEQAHKQALYKLEDEKRNHGEFMKKSDEFTNLLEQERERSVRPERRRVSLRGSSTSERFDNHPESLCSTVLNNTF